MQKPAFSIAPKAERERPLPARLRWAVVYFRATAVLGALGIGGAFLASKLVDRAKVPFPPMSRLAPLLLVGAFSCGCAWWTARLLSERRRQGGWLALGTLLPAVAEWGMRGSHAAGHHSGVALSGVLGVLGALAVLTSWRELD